MLSVCCILYLSDRDVKEERVGRGGRSRLNQTSQNNTFAASVCPLHDEEAVTDPDCMAEQSDSLICAAYKSSLLLMDLRQLFSANKRALKTPLVTTCSKPNVRQR